VPIVARLNVTPVKSTALHHPERVRLEPYGAVGNRELYVVDEDGRLVGGSKIGSLVQIAAELDPSTDRLTLCFPDGTVVEGDAGATTTAITTNFWGRPVAGHLVDGGFAEALTSFAGRTLRLARVDTPGDGSDIEPVTLVSLASVQELSRQGGRDAPVDAGRFRMLIELGDADPHEEDTWAGRPVRVGEAVIRVGDQVPRCVVTTQDPRTGLRDFPTLTVIKRYRGTTAANKLPFGVYATVERPGTIAVGDEVETG
jgi:uncharacterized protein YcbX